MVNTFKNYDKDNNGAIDKNDIKPALKNMGYRDYSDAEIDKAMEKVDKPQNGVIEWDEFVDVMRDLGEMFESNRKVNEENKHAMEEVSSFSRLINKKLENVAELKERLPINPDSTTDLFNTLYDGMIGLHLLNVCEKDRIDMRTVNKGENLNVFEIRQNLNHFLTGCKGLVKVVNTGSQDFLDKNSTMMLGIIWQLCRIISVEKINLKTYNQLVALLEDGETLTDLMRLKPEEILKRWLNYHLKNAGQPPINNLGKDLADSRSLLYVMNQLDNAKCKLDGLNRYDDDLKRAEIMINNSFALGCADVVGPKDIVKGNEKVNIIFVAELFNTKHGLDDNDLVIDEETREERAFKQWINSLGIDDVFIESDLYASLSDGLILLKVIHKLNDKAVDWSKVAK